MSSSKSKSSLSRKPIKAKITSSMALLELLESIDTSWHITRTFNINHVTFKKGDLLLKEGSLRGARDLDALRNLAIGDQILVLSKAHHPSSASSQTISLAKKEGLTFKNKVSSNGLSPSPEGLEPRIEALTRKVGLMSVRRRRRTMRKIPNALQG